MLIKYKEYIGALIYACQIEGSLFKFRIKDSDDTVIEFTTEMNQIRIVDCIGNSTILSEIRK